jgi:hypothetical protein
MVSILRFGSAILDSSNVVFYDEDQHSQMGLIWKTVYFYKIDLKIRFKVVFMQYKAEYLKKLAIKKGATRAPSFIFKA